MADKTKIEWTGATWNPITGCTMVSTGCENCYAMTLAGTRLRDHPSRAGLTRELPSGRHVWTGEMRLNKDWIDQPVRWKKPKTIFVCAHGDLFHGYVPDEWVALIFAVIHRCPQHTFQVLTKRPERMQMLLESRQFWRLVRAWGKGNLRMCATDASLDDSAIVLPNMWLGTSVEDQRTANERIPHLLATPAAIRWISAEPLLGPIDLTHIGGDGFGWRRLDCLNGLRYVRANGLEDGCEWETEKAQGLDWVVVGGESGPDARPFNLDWARAIIRQCEDTHIPVFVKQIGSNPWWDGEGLPPADYIHLERAFLDGVSRWKLDLLQSRKGGDPFEWPEDMRVRQMPEVTV